MSNPVNELLTGVLLLRLDVELKIWLDEGHPLLDCTLQPRERRQFIDQALFSQTGSYSRPRYLISRATTRRQSANYTNAKG